MDFSAYLQKYQPDVKQLRSFGFVPDGTAWVYQAPLARPNLVAVFKVTRDQIDVRVLDQDFQDDYLPFNVKDQPCAARIEVEQLWQNILTQCFVATDIKEKVIAALRTAYGTEPERPWATYPGYCTCKTAQRQKWYAIIMQVKPGVLGLPGNELVDIINVKIEPEKIVTIVDQQHYFPAYHMNKKHWLTILLDRQTVWDELWALLQNSYRLVEKY